MEELIKEYIKNIDEYTIKKYAKTNDIFLTDEETKVIYLYIKNYWKIFYKEDPSSLFEELEEQISKENLLKIKKLYKKYKEKINY